MSLQRVFPVKSKRKPKAANTMEREEHLFPVCICEVYQNGM